MGLRLLGHKKVSKSKRLRLCSLPLYQLSPMPTFSRLNAQRKYIELIEESSAKWPNWDPARSIRVRHHIYSWSVCTLTNPPQAGDFGTTNKKTGELMIEGNIYSHGDIAPIANLHPPIQEAEVDHYQIQSHEVRGLDVEAHAGT